MAPKRRDLPSLGSLATFEVAAKHLSLTLAGTELNITQGAICQQIRGLDDSPCAYTDPHWYTHGRLGSRPSAPKAPSH